MDSPRNISVRTIRCVSIVASVLLIGSGLAVGQTTDQLSSRLWQPEGLKRVYGSGRGHHWWEVYAVDYSADGKSVVTGGGDQHVFVWDAASLKPIASALHLASTIHSVSFHPRGKRIAAGLSDGQVWIFEFDGQSLTERHRLTGYGARCGVHYTDDGSRLVVGSRSHTYLYDVTRERPIETRVINAGGWAFDVQGNTLAIAEDDALSIWDIGAARPRKITEHEGRFISVAIAPDQKSFATGGFDRKAALSLWKLDDGQLVKEIAWDGKNNGPIRSVRFSPDGRRLASTTSNANEILLWDLAQIPTGEIALSGHTAKTFELVFSPDGSQLATASSDHSVRLWGLNEMHREHRCSQDANRWPSRFIFVWYADNGKRLLAKCHVPGKQLPLPGGATARQVKMMIADLTNGTTFDEPPSPPMRIAADSYHSQESAFSHSGMYAATLIIPKAPKNAPSESVEPQESLPSYIHIKACTPDPKGDSTPVVLEGQFTELAWNQDDRQLVTGGGGNLQRWDAQSGRLLDEVAVKGETVALCCPANARVIAVQQEQTELADYKTWFLEWLPDRTPNTVKHSFTGPSKLNKVCISRNGEFIAVRERRGPIYVYQHDGDQFWLLRKFEIHGQYFMDEFSPNGELLAMHTWGYHEDLVGLFDSRTGEKVREWRAMGDTMGATFSPDGTALALSNLNGTVYVLEVPQAPALRDSDQTAPPKVEDRVPRTFQAPIDEPNARKLLDVINSEYEVARSVWRKKANAEQTKEWQHTRHLDFAMRYMSLAESTQGTSVGRDALIGVCHGGLIYKDHSHNRQLRRLQAKAGTALLDRHFLDSALLPVVDTICNTQKDCAVIARRFIREHGDRSVQAKASLSLARHYDGRYYYRRADLSQQAMIISLYQQLIDNYGELLFYDGGPTYRNVAEREIRQIRAR